MKYIIIIFFLTNIVISGNIVYKKSNLNTPPIADAGNDKNLYNVSMVTLDANASYDTDGDLLTYRWFLLDKPSGSNAKLSNKTSVKPTFIADRYGTYVFKLVVNDSFLDSTVDTVSITISNEFIFTITKLDNLVEQYSLGSFKIDKLTKNYITFSKSEGNITDDVLYDRREDNFNFDGLYKVENSTGDISYFRYGDSFFKSKKTTFLGVQWANNKMPFESNGLFRISVVKNTYKAMGEINVTIIGDSITWKHYGTYLRKLLSQKDSSYNYTGSRTDTFGYGHEGEGGNSTQDVINRLSEIVKSDIYILMIGTNDVYLDNNKTLENIKIIVDNLLTKSPKSIVYVGTILPHLNEYADAVIKLINKNIRVWINNNTNQRIILMDIEKDFKNISNWELLFPPGNIHPSLKGYKELSSIIYEKIKKQ